MKTKQAFLMGSAAVVAFIAAAAMTAFAKPAASASGSGFVFTKAQAQEFVYTYNGVPVSCVDYPAASDSYVWNVNLGKINQQFIINLKNRIYITALSGGSCDPITDVTSTMAIPWTGPQVEPKPVGPLFYADFVGAVPDFSTINNSNDLGLPFFEDLGFHLVFNNAVGGNAGGIAGKTGTLEVLGNANLCESIINGGPQCFILDLNYDDYMHNRADDACICTTPSIQTLDITDIIGPD